MVRAASHLLALAVVVEPRCVRALHLVAVAASLVLVVAVALQSRQVGAEDKTLQRKQRNYHKFCSIRDLSVRPNSNNLVVDSINLADSSPAYGDKTGGKAPMGDMPYCGPGGGG